MVALKRVLCYVGGLFALLALALGWWVVRTDTKAISPAATVSVIKLHGQPCLLIDAPPNNLFGRSQALRWGYDEASGHLWIVEQYVIWNPLDSFPAEMNYPLVIGLENMRRTNYSWKENVKVTTLGRELGTLNTRTLQWVPRG